MDFMDFIDDANEEVKKTWNMGTTWWPSPLIFCFGEAHYNDGAMMNERIAKSFIENMTDDVAGSYSEYSRVRHHQVALFRLLRLY
jgi:hypothetical protein